MGSDASFALDDGVATVFAYQLDACAGFELAFRRPRLLWATEIIVCAAEADDGVGELRRGFGVLNIFFHAPFVDGLHHQDFAFAGYVVHMKRFGVGVFDFRDLQVGDHALFHRVISLAGHGVEAPVLFAMAFGMEHHAGDRIGPDTGVAFFVCVVTEHAVAGEFHASKGAGEIADEPEAAGLYPGSFLAGAIHHLSGGVVHF